MKQLLNAALCYAILAMTGGVFYREFTRWNNFTGTSALSVLHTHYFLLGMVFFLILLLLEKSFSFSNRKTKKTLLTYHIGLNLTCIMLLVRGMLQVAEVPLPKAVDFSISGIAGIGHMVLSISMVLLLLQVRSALVKDRDVTQETRA